MSIGNVHHTVREVQLVRDLRMHAVSSCIPAQFWDQDSRVFLMLHTECGKEKEHMLYVQWLLAIHLT